MISLQLLSHPSEFHFLTSPAATMLLGLLVLLVVASTR